MCVGSTVGPNIFVKICGWSTAQISRELKATIKKEFKKIPKNEINQLCGWWKFCIWFFGVNLLIMIKHR